MALGDLVRTIFVRLREDGADQVKAAIDDVAARAAALSKMDPTVKIGVDREGLQALRAFKTELDALTSSGDQAGLMALASRLKRFGEESDSVRTKTSALALELRALKGAAADAAGAIGTDSGGRGSGLAGALAGLTAGAGAGAGGGAAGGIGIAALIAAPTGLLGIIPAAAAAAAGIVSFGALAYPTITTVTGAVSSLATATATYKAAIGDVAKDQALTVIRQQWAALTPVQAQMVRDVQAIQTAWGNLTTAFAPKLMPIFTDLFLALSRIMQQMVPFANVAAGALDKLLQGFNQFLSSPGFAVFRAEMLRLEGPAILAIGRGIGEIVIAVGKLLMALASPDALRIFGFLVKGLAGDIVILADVVKWATAFMITAFHDVAYNFDTVRHNIATSGHNIAVVFDDLRHGVAYLADTFAANLIGMGRTFASWVADVIRVGGDVIRWFEQLPGRIASFLAGLPAMLFRAGQNAIQGLINGLGSMLGNLGSMAASVASKIAGFFGLSPAVEGPLSGMGAPEIRGRHFADALAMGIASGTGGVGAAAAGLAHATAMGGYGGGRGGLTVEITVPRGGAVLGPEFWTALAYGTRIRGGDPAMYQRKVKFA